LDTPVVGAGGTQDALTQALYQAVSADDGCGSYRGHARQGALTPAAADFQPPYFPPPYPAVPQPSSVDPATVGHQTASTGARGLNVYAGFTGAPGVQTLAAPAAAPQHYRLPSATSGKW